MSNKGNFKFSVYLRQLRKMRNLTLEKVAEKSGLSAGYISMLETGKKTYPSANALKKLAKALHIPNDQLLTMIGYIAELEDEEKKKNTDEGSNLFIFDLEGLTEDDIKHLKEQIDLLKLRAKYNRSEKED
ncbi:helix-turn-helix domain-containing protein [Bacillus sp. FSL M8-0168]|uniref:helix-turn-helix domain-containing protein n=1 Tax=Bacillus sp. FSL M8-0168 TaxID=2921614 RepID=UPI0030FD8426